MKSPWKFLVGLTGRHNKKDPLKSPALAPDDARPNFSEPDRPSIVPVVVPPAAGIDIKTSIEPEADGLQHVDDVAALAAIEASAASRKPEKNSETLRKEPSRRGRKQAQVAPRTNIRTPVAIPQSELSNEHVLDDEIRQLRFQLTEKLKLQNDQLRRMLERFDRL
jgi:hypothetical protein